MITVNFSLTERDVTIKKIRELINKLEVLGVDENLQLDGYLNYLVEVDPRAIETIECCDCAPYKNNNDWIFTIHNCARWGI